MHLLGKNYAEIRHFFIISIKIMQKLGKFNVLILIFGKSSAKLGNKKVFNPYDRMLVIVSYKKFYVK